MRVCRYALGSVASLFYHFALGSVAYRLLSVVESGSGDACGICFFGTIEKLRGIKGFH